MTDLFTNRKAKAMLLYETEPFDSNEYIYELKLDGIRCLAYIDDFTELRNKRNKILNDIYPELKDIHLNVNKKCILDGELIVLTDGKPNFFEVQRRSLMTDKFRIELLSKQKPVLFIAYDILYYINEEIIYKPLKERKEILESIINENSKIAVSRYIEDHGIDYYNNVKSQDLEGVIAKKKDSIYVMGKRSKNWLKIKNMKDSDFVVCGYVPNNKGGIKTLSLGVYKDNKLIDQGHVSLGIPKNEERIILDYAKDNITDCPFEKCDEKTIWIKPNFVCSVKYMMRTESGYLRQPVFKGLRPDKEISECKINV